MNRIVSHTGRAVLIIAAAAFIPATAQGAGKTSWETLEKCQLIDNPSNDGDSFHFRAQNSEYVGRLYLVDTPEIGGIRPAMLVDQAKYFGIDVPETIEIGRKAKAFTQSKLAQPFTVITRLAAGLGQSKTGRYYVFVQTKDGDLGELLVANGLARVHGTRAAPPGAKSATEEIQKLKDLEQQAKQAKRGGWNQSTGSAATTSQPAATVSVPLPATVQTPALVQTLPKRLTTTPTPVARTTRMPSSIFSSPLPSPATAATAGKLDINTASKEELEKIPGVGSGLSERIIAARPFRSADELKNVKGIGEGKRYEQIRAYFQ